MGPPIETCDADVEPRPRIADVDSVCRLIAAQSYCNLAGETAHALLQERHTSVLADWQRFSESWSRLPRDGYMADGGSYRRRRHATLRADHSSGGPRLQPHQAHFQSLAYNTLNGGIARHYKPIEDTIVRGTTMQALLGLGCDLFGRLAPYSDWHIEVHQFRIDVGAGHAGLPTPEGTHRDGVSFVMMVVVQRHNVAGGETVIYDLESRPQAQFTLTDPLDMAITNDERVLHAVTPVTQLDPTTPGFRDVLVVTFRHDN
jgi:hypothetical protein